MIALKVFISIMNRMEFRLVHNQKENRRNDHILVNFKENGNLFGKFVGGVMRNVKRF